MKKILLVLLAVFICLLSFSGCAAKPVQPEEEAVTVKLGLIKGPTGIGASFLLEKNEKGESLNQYEYALAAEPTDMVAQVINGSVDIAAVPTNSASAIYNKTNGKVQILALNTGCVLYILEQGNTVNSLADLKGRTVYATGQGANPEYILNYLLKVNGLTVNEDVTVEYLDSAELSTRAASGQVELCMLPVPAATTVLMKNQNMRQAVSLEEEWNKLNRNTSITMGCIVVRKAFAAEHPQAVRKFLEEYEESVDYVINHVSEAAALCEKFEIVPSAGVAAKAIPGANLMFVAGKDIKPVLEDYYQLLLEADAKSVGGQLPGEDFYYVQQ